MAWEFDDARVGQLIEISGVDVKAFRWRTSTGYMQRPRDMKTKHLFYTWLMIWNHSVPKPYTIWWNHRYTFNAFYTKRYMYEAFASLYVELKRRTDLGPAMQNVVHRIEAYFLREPKMIQPKELSHET